MLESRYEALLAAADMPQSAMIAMDGPRPNLPLFLLTPIVKQIPLGSIPLENRSLPFESFVIEHRIDIAGGLTHAFIFVDCLNSRGTEYKLQSVLYGHGHRIAMPAATLRHNLDTGLIECLEVHGQVRPHVQVDYRDETRAAAAEVQRLLYLLSIRGIATETVEPPAALNKKRLKHGKTPLSPYILVKVGKVYDRHGNEVPEGERRTVTPHIRAGHSRMQPHGPRNTLRKPVFIPPTFVNYVDGVEAQNRPRIVTL